MKRLLALLLAIVIVVGLVVVAIPASAAQSETSTYKVGYAKLDVNPWILYPDGTAPEGVQNMTGENGNAIGVPYNAAWANSAYADRVRTTTADGKTVGIIATRLAGAGTSADNYAYGLLDDNGDGKVGYGDGLQVTATTVTDANGKTAVFVTIDSIGGYPVMQNYLRKELVAQTNGAIDADGIYVNGSHSHNAPDMENLNTASKKEPNGPVGAYWTYYKQRVVDAVLAALDNAVPSVMSKGTVDASEKTGYQLNFVRQYYSKDTYTVGNETKNYIVGSNFGYPHRGANYYKEDIYAADDSMHILQFTPVGGGKSTVLVNWRAHGTFIGGSYLLYSSDYIGSLRAKMEAAGYNIAFLQGAGGNAVPEHLIDGKTPWKNEAYTYNGVDPTTDNSLKDALHYGDLLSRVALACLDNKNMQTLNAGDIRYQNQSFTFNYQQDTDEQKIVAAWWGALVEAYSKEYGVAMGAASQALGFTKSTSADFGRTHTITIDNDKYSTASEHNGEEAIFNSYYHLHNAYLRTQNTESTGAMTVGSIMLGDQVAMVVAGNELFDKYYGYDPLTDTYNTAVNAWDSLKTDVYDTPFVLAYTNGSHAYMPNLWSYDLNEGAPDVAPGIYESNTSNYASGTGEKLIAQYKTMLDDLNGVAVSGSTYYDTIEEAVEEVTEGSLITLNCAENAEALTIDKNLTIDFNGCNFTGEINVATGKTLYCMDSATADFTVADNAYTKIPTAKITGEGKVAGVPEDSDLIADGLQYVMIDDGENYSFHCVKLDTYAITVQAYEGDSKNPSVYYTSDFATDEVVAAKVTQRGVALSILEEPTAENFTTKCSSTELMKDGEKFTAGANNANSGNGTLLYNILNPKNAELVNRRNANTKVYGKAYMVIKDAEGNKEYLFGNATDNTADQTKGYSLKDAFEAANDSWNSSAKDPEVIASIEGTIKTYNAIMKSWSIKNIREAVAANDNVLKILNISNSHGQDAIWLLPSVLKAERPNQKFVIVEMYQGYALTEHIKAAKANSPVYHYQINTGDGWTTVSKEMTIAEALQTHNWDIVSFNESSRHLGLESKMSQGMVDWFLNYILENLGYSPKMQYNMTWASPTDERFYTDDTRQPATATFKNIYTQDYGFDHVNHYNQLVALTKKYLVGHEGFDEIIYNATPVQYAGEVLKVPQYDENQVYDLYRDYTHLSDYARLIVAYNWYCQMFDVEKLDAVNVDMIEWENRAPWNGRHKKLGDLTLTPEHKSVLIKSVNHSLQYPLSITAE